MIWAYESLTTMRIIIEIQNAFLLLLVAWYKTKSMFELKLTNCMSYLRACLQNSLRP